ncbi:MAG: sodium:solute symporter [Candidatus Hydrogenedentes bacterium]|nr:sodium:solute symporter [Candidatus Hydrogenedentota bacterium]
MNEHFHILDWIVLIGYFGVTMGIGLSFYRKTRTPEGYTAANRSLPGWACGLSILATYLSSISYLALPGKSFAANWNPFVFSLSIPVVAIIAVKYFLPYYRRSGEVSAYALLERRFGPWARVYASAFYLLTQVARIAVVMYLMALPMQVIFGWNIYTILIVTGVCVTFYSFVGGLTAVIWTDAIQAIVLMAGAVACLAIMLIHMPGGAIKALATTTVQGKFSLGSFAPSLAAPTFWVVLLYGITINLQNFGIDQSYIQRYIASNSDRQARKSLWIGSLLYVPLSALFFLIGTSLFAYYQAGAPVHGNAVSDLDEVKLIVARQRLLQQGISPDAPSFRSQQTKIAGTLTLKDIGDRVFPHFIAKHLPAGLTGLLIAAIFAAAMSTVSTSLNSSATLLMSDYFKRFINPHAGKKQTMLVLYGGTILWGALGTGLSLVLVRLTDSALDIWWILSGIFGGGMCGLFLLGMISRRAGNTAAITGVLAGVTGILWLSLPKCLDYMLAMPPTTSMRRWAETIHSSMGGMLSPFHAFMVPVFGTLTILTVGAVTGYISDKPASIEKG